MVLKKYLDTGQYFKNSNKLSIYLLSENSILAQCDVFQHT